MKEKIQPYEIVGKGVATEALVEIQSRYTTQDKAVIYYDLRDKTQTSTVRVYTTGEILTLPYKVISYQKIIVTGDDRAAIGADAKFASNIVFRERTDIVKGSTSTAITVGISYGNPNEACKNFLNGKTKVFYIDNADFSLATLLAEDEGMTAVVKEAVYIAGDSMIRYWKGDSFDQEFLDVCGKG
jgi:hypothetical protein